MYKHQTSLGVHMTSSGKCWSAFWWVWIASSASVAWVCQVSRVWLSNDVKSFVNASHYALWLWHSQNQHDEVPGTSVPRNNITNCAGNFQSVIMSVILTVTGRWLQWEYITSYKGGIITSRKLFWLSLKIIASQCTVTKGDTTLL